MDLRRGSPTTACRVGAAKWGQGTWDRGQGSGEQGTERQQNWDREWAGNWRQQTRGNLGQGTGDRELGQGTGAGNWRAGNWAANWRQGTRAGNWRQQTGELEAGNWDRELGQGTWAGNWRRVAVSCHDTKKRAGVAICGVAGQPQPRANAPKNFDPFQKPCEPIRTRTLIKAHRWISDEADLQLHSLKSWEQQNGDRELGTGN